MITGHYMRKLQDHRATKSSAFLIRLTIASVCLIVSLSPQNASAQASITLGAQTFYDDNVFLENDRSRPATIVTNSDLALATTLPGSRALSSQNGEKDSDFITNLYVGADGNYNRFEKFFDLAYSMQTGVIIFSEFSEQDRITLDGNLSFDLSEHILSRPFYFNVSNYLQSSSNNLAVASGTATQTVQNYVASVATGVSDVHIAPNTSANLGYIGSYQIYLGEFLLNGSDSSNSTTQRGGTDFHSHIAQSSVNHQATKELTVGAAANGGVQLFTAIDESGSSGSLQNRDPSDLDRFNSEVQGTTTYIITRKLNFQGSAGVGYSQLLNDPLPITTTVVDEQGNTKTVTETPDDSSTGLTFTSALTYAIRPGSLLSAGATQGFSTNIDGQRFISRAFFLNFVEPLTRDLQLTLAGRYIQLEDQSSLRPDTDRIEASASLNYFLQDNLSVQLGYNFATQDADTLFDDPNLSFTESDYDSNRIFIGISGGFVGLPL